jgi:hypothetical protein
MHQLTIPEFLAYLDQLDTTPTKDLDQTTIRDSIHTKLELLTSAYLDFLSISTLRHIFGAQNFSANFDVFEAIFGPNFRPFYDTVLRPFLGQFIDLNKMVINGTPRKRPSKSCVLRHV